MVIAFQGGDILNANGSYLWLLYNEITARHELDEDFKFELYMATNSYKCIDFERMRPDRRIKLMQMLKDLAIEILNDTEHILWSEKSPEWHQNYRQSLQKLLNHIEKYEKADWPEPEEE